MTVWNHPQNGGCPEISQWKWQTAHSYQNKSKTLLTNNCIIQKYLGSVAAGSICCMAVVWEIKAVHDELVPYLCLWWERTTQSKSGGAQHPQYFHEIHPYWLSQSNFFSSKLISFLVSFLTLSYHWKESSSFGKKKFQCNSDIFMSSITDWEVSCLTTPRDFSLCVLCNILH